MTARTLWTVEAMASAMSAASTPLVAWPRTSRMAAAWRSGPPPGYGYAHRCVLVRHRTIQAPGYQLAEKPPKMARGAPGSK